MKRREFIDPMRPFGLGAHDVLSRLQFVNEAAMRIAAAINASPSTDPDADHPVIARLSLDSAEALWDELCARFPEDEDDDED